MKKVIQAVDPNEIITTESDLPTVGISGVHPDLKNPGDKFSQEVSPSGNMVVTKLKTSEKNRTLVTHKKKDGSRGKSVGYVMEP